jgi:hypothetical protein|nr:MAG TPA: hypothetical protein [Caudoviricetes sp.]
MDNLERMKLRTGESNIAVLRDCLDSARAAIMARRYPYGDWPDELESRYLDLQYRIAIDLYNKTGAEGQTGHTENSISRTWESSWISESLLQEVTPLAGMVT